MRKQTFEARVRGCLIGAAVGAELGFSKTARPGNFAVERPSDVFGVKLEPAFDYVEEKGRVADANCRAIVDLGIRAYLEKQGRVTAEDFGRLLKDDPGIAKPAICWDGMHTVQELLKEGMNPRISGLGNAPTGFMTPAMLGVGIYHYADPEYAYLDGVELASVAQPRKGADWAALAAGAIACALGPSADEENVVETVLKLAHANNKELFYTMNNRRGEASRLSGQEEAFLNWWCFVGGRTDTTNEQQWFAYNPVGYVLPLLKAFGSRPEKLMALLLAPSNYAATTAPIVAGAIAGAIHGADVFPEEWLKWAEPIAEPWFGIIDVVNKRRQKDREIVAVIDRLLKKQENGDTLLFDKVYGCILAGAIGNAMGSPVENRFYWEVDEKFPGGIKTVINPKCLESEDDNQMAMLLVETYLQREGHPVSARHFGRTWYDRLNRQHFYAQCMGNAYDLIRKGWDPRITGHWSVVTGSTVMCMEPVGIYHLADPENAGIDAKAISYMYQRGLDVTAAVILASAVAEALRPEATVDSVCEAALKAAPKEKMNTFDKREFDSPYDYIVRCLEIAGKYDDVFAVRKELYDKCMLYHAIDPLEVIGFSLAMFKVADGDVRLAAIGGTNIGRDSDTIAGRAAMLSGALRGSGNVPQDWIDLFKPSVLEGIRGNSARLVELIVDKKIAMLRSRTEIA
ncbi:MAG: ADP-ribosylglycohydrolase family protein [Armatimonadota bacterium]|nr:ADP-ribosylglycohydrolase family protein [Armatimonadota bacterium]